jgi:hypothetical protein
LLLNLSPFLRGKREARRRAAIGVRGRHPPRSAGEDEGKSFPCPKVLISDALSPAAVQIFKDRGIEVDFQPNLGKDKDKLAEIIGNYDGLAIRSATKATAKISRRRRG